MEPSSSGTKDNDKETRDLRSLLECFDSLCTLEEIADAYCIAQQDVMEAGDLLYKLQDRKRNSVSHAQNGLKSYSQGKELVHEDKLECITHHDNKCMKPKKLSASFGTVSGAVAKTYGRFSAPRNELNEKIKPPKLKIEEPLVDESISKFVLRNDTFNDKDIQDFMFSMLGNGFQLSMDIIQEVLGNCGYNIKESMNQLLALSAKTLEKGKEVDINVIKKPSQMETSGSQESYPNSSSSIRIDNKSANLPNEVLQSLFILPERSDEESKLKHTELEFNRKEVFGQAEVEEPLDDITFSSPPRYTSKTKVVNHDVDEVDNYRILRKAAKQHWDAMKEYYESAIDAFTKGDKERANYLLEQGIYHNQMAREANEKSAKEIVEPRENNKEEVIDLDLRAHDAKEALDILKIHLRSLANIISFSCLKLILCPDTEDSKSRRKRRMVIKLLEKESIKWCEDSDAPGTIRIQLDEVDPEELSFRKSSHL